MRDKPTNTMVFILILSIFIIIAAPSELLSQLIMGFEISPANPSQTDTITITVNGATSNTAIHLTNSNCVIDNTSIQINLYFDWVGEFGATVFTFYAYPFDTLLAHPGYYTIKCNTFLGEENYDYADTTFNVNLYTDIRNYEPSGNNVNFFGPSQNYPNPFNPFTIIRYTLHEPNPVSLKIYNVCGQEIITLVNSFQKSGTYEVKWEPVNYPGGLYFYRLQAGSFSETKKLIFQK